MSSAAFLASSVDRVSVFDFAANSFVNKEAMPTENLKKQISYSIIKRDSCLIHKKDNV